MTSLLYANSCASNYPEMSITLDLATIPLSDLNTRFWNVPGCKTGVNSDWSDSDSTIKLVLVESFRLNLKYLVRDRLGNS